jgi:phosphoribosylamine--glycine ligase
MRILVIGSGGREHAMLWAMAGGGAEEPPKGRTTNAELFCAPGNAGIAQIATCVPIGVTDVAGLAAFAEENRIDLTVAGGETSLAAGVADEFAARGLLLAGATQAAARLESSKAFAKDFMIRHGIPTARYRVADSVTEALDCLRSGEFGDESGPVVVKVDGLAAGKGVVVARSRANAEAAVHELSAGEPTRLVLEEALTGREASLLVFADGKDYAIMPAARDHKRVGEGDTGPNTGGMGAVTEDGILDDAALHAALKQVIEPALAGAAAEGFPFRGILFAGLMLTPDGIRVLEFNVRFGDPEAQAILIRLRTDLSQVLEAVARGTLGDIGLEWSSDASACVVAAAKGYPGKPVTGSVIHGLDAAAKHANVQVFHAGTARDDLGNFVTAGGRVLGITSTGARLEDALKNSYVALDDINWDGMHFRRDIGRTT